MNFSFFWFGSFVVAGGTALAELIPLGISRKAESIGWGYALILCMYIILVKSKKVYDVIEKIMMFVAIGTFLGLAISCSYKTVLEKIPEFFSSFLEPNIKVLERNDYEKVITAITFMGLGGFWSLFLLILDFRQRNGDGKTNTREIHIWIHTIKRYTKRPNINLEKGFAT
jgi:Mn2+/Fe2+ NRAMP family transporter